MTDDVKDVVKVNEGTPIPGEGTDGASLSPREQQEIAIKDKAKSLGWKPLKEYEGDPSDWVTAKEFISRQSFFDKIRAQSTEIRSLRDDIRTMSQHFAQMKEVEYKRALADLKAERKDAIAQGDTVAADAVSDQIVEIETARKELKQTPSQKANYGQAEFADFKARNTWYNQDPELTQKANVIGLGYAQLHPNATPSDVLEYMEKEIKPIVKKQVVAPSSPDKSGVRQGPGSKSGKITEADLTPMQKKMMDTFIQRGVLTKEKYLDDLSKAEGNR